MKIKPITILLFFLLCIPIQMLAQKNDAAATIEQLEKEILKTDTGLYPMLTNGWATGKNRCN